MDGILKAGTVLHEAYHPPHDLFMQWTEIPSVFNYESIPIAHTLIAEYAGNLTPVADFLTIEQTLLTIEITNTRGFYIIMVGCFTYAAFMSKPGIFYFYNSHANSTYDINTAHVLLFNRQSLVGFLHDAHPSTHLDSTTTIFNVVHLSFNKSTLKRKVDFDDAAAASMIKRVTDATAVSSPLYTRDTGASEQIENVLASHLNASLTLVNADVVRASPVQSPVFIDYHVLAAPVLDMANDITTRVARSPIVVNKLKSHLLIAALEATLCSVIVDQGVTLRNTTSAADLLARRVTVLFKDIAHDCIHATNNIASSNGNIFTLVSQWNNGTLSSACIRKLTAVVDGFNADASLVLSKLRTAPLDDIAGLIRGVPLWTTTAASQVNDILKERIPALYDIKENAEKELARRRMLLSALKTCLYDIAAPFPTVDALNDTTTSATCVTSLVTIVNEACAALAKRATDDVDTAITTCKFNRSMFTMTSDTTVLLKNVHKIHSFLTRKFDALDFSADVAAVLRLPQTHIHPSDSTYPKTTQDWVDLLNVSPATAAAIVQLNASATEFVNMEYTLNALLDEMAPYLHGTMPIDPQTHGAFAQRTHDISVAYTVLMLPDRVTRVNEVVRHVAELMEKQTVATILSEGIGFFTSHEESAFVIIKDCPAWTVAFAQDMPQVIPVLTSDTKFQTLLRQTLTAAWLIYSKRLLDTAGWIENINDAFLKVMQLLLPSWEHTQLGVYMTTVADRFHTEIPAALRDASNDASTVDTMLFETDISDLLVAMHNKTADCGDVKSFVLDVQHRLETKAVARKLQLDTEDAKRRADTVLSDLQQFKTKHGGKLLPLEFTREMEAAVALLVERGNAILKIAKKHNLPAAVKLEHEITDFSTAFIPQLQLDILKKNVDVRYGLLLTAICDTLKAAVLRKTFDSAQSQELTVNVRAAVEFQRRVIDPLATAEYGSAKAAASAFVSHFSTDLEHGVHALFKRSRYDAGGTLDDDTLSKAVAWCGLVADAYRTLNLVFPYVALAADVALATLVFDISNTIASDPSTQQHELTRAYATRFLAIAAVSHYVAFYSRYDDYATVLTALKRTAQDIAVAQDAIALRVREWTTRVETYSQTALLQTFKHQCAIAFDKDMLSVEAAVMAVERRTFVELSGTAYDDALTRTQKNMISSVRQTAKSLNNARADLNGAIDARELELKTEEAYWQDQVRRAHDELLNAIITSAPTPHAGVVTPADTPESVVNKLTKIFNGAIKNVTTDSETSIRWLRDSFALIQNYPFVGPYKETVDAMLKHVIAASSHVTNTVRVLESIDELTRKIGNDLDTINDTESEAFASGDLTLVESVIVTINNAVAQIDILETLWVNFDSTTLSQSHVSRVSAATKEKSLLLKKLDTATRVASLVTEFSKLITVAPTTFGYADLIEMLADLDRLSHDRLFPLTWGGDAKRLKPILNGRVALYEAYSNHHVTFPDHHVARPHTAPSGDAPQVAFDMPKRVSRLLDVLNTQHIDFSETVHDLDAVRPRYIIDGRPLHDMLLFVTPHEKYMHMYYVPDVRTPPVVVTTEAKNRNLLTDTVTVMAHNWSAILSPASVTAYNALLDAQGSYREFGQIDNVYQYVLMYIGAINYAKHILTTHCSDAAPDVTAHDITLSLKDFVVLMMLMVPEHILAFAQLNFTAQFAYVDATLASVVEYVCATRLFRSPSSCDWGHATGFTMLRDDVRIVSVGSRTLRDVLWDVFNHNDHMANRDQLSFFDTESALYAFVYAHFLSSMPEKERQMLWSTLSVTADGVDQYIATSLTHARTVTITDSAAMGIHDTDDVVRRVHVSSNAPTKHRMTAFDVAIMCVLLRINAYVCEIVDVFSKDVPFVFLKKIFHTAAPSIDKMSAYTDACTSFLDELLVSDFHPVETTCLMAQRTHVKNLLSAKIMPDQTVVPVFIVDKTRAVTGILWDKGTATDNVFHVIIDTFNIQTNGMVVYPRQVSRPSVADDDDIFLHSTFSLSKISFDQLVQRPARVEASPVAFSDDTESLFNEIDILYNDIILAPPPANVPVGVPLDDVLDFNPDAVEQHQTLLDTFNIITTSLTTFQRTIKHLLADIRLRVYHNVDYITQAMNRIKLYLQ